MHDLAWGSVFNIDPIARQIKLTFELREMLEALIEVDAAYKQVANKDICLVAGELTLNKSTNKVDAVIGQLVVLGFVNFTPFNGGSKLVIPEETLSAFKKLERYATIIDTVTRVEDRGLEIDDQTQIFIKELEAAKIYIGFSDAELDKLMHDEIKCILTQRREDRQMKKKNKIVSELRGSEKMTGMTKLIAVSLIASAVFITTSQGALADRAGTVGLTLVEGAAY